MRAALPVLLAVTLGACSDESGAARDRPAAGPALIGFEYQDAAHQLVVTARDRNGQVIGVELAGPIVLMADGRCGLEGRRNGDVTRFVLPARRLPPGRHHFDVRLTSSSCDAGERTREQATDVTLTVAPDGTANAVDGSGRPLS